MSTSLVDRLLIVIATYNERDNLTTLLEAIRRHVPTAEVLVIDDNSPDGTGQLADQLAGANPWLHVLHRTGKLGLGTALLAGLRYAMDHDYDLALTMDADLSHEPRYLPALLAGMKKNDVMIGSRYVPGGGTIGWPMSRKVMSAGVNILVRVLMRLSPHDCSGGYRCYRVSKLREAKLDQLLSRGYSFQEEVLYRCRQAHCRIGETPIVFENRRVGTSKVNVGEIVHSLAILLRLGIPAFFGLDQWTTRQSKALIGSP